MTNGSAHELALRVAARLDAESGSDVKREVERRLAKGGETEPTTFEPLALGLASLIVSITGLAWTVYRDLRSKRSDDPSPLAPVVARRLRIELAMAEIPSHSESDRVLAIVLEELAEITSGER